MTREGSDAARCAVCGSRLFDGRCARCWLELAVSTDTVENRSGQVLGDFELVKVIGRGGSGTVYEALQRSIGRPVAVKVIGHPPDCDATEVEQLVREARAASRLQHSGIVRVIDAGHDAGCSFIAMELVHGKTLLQEVGVTPLPAKRAARYVEKAAKAMAHAHEEGILHLDLKPSNVLLRRGKRPLVADFGLAQPLNRSSLPTSTKSIRGTPAYMAPEQAAGKLSQFDARTDVYGLGATLYHCLTARPPFGAATQLETLEAVREHDPVPPRALNPSVPFDLETICLQCLAKKREDRYATARELAEDLRRFRKKLRILGRRPGLFRRAARIVRRKPVNALLVAAVAAFAFAMTVAAWLFREETLDSNVQSARLAATVLRSHLAELGHVVELEASRLALRRSLSTADPEAKRRAVAQAFESHTALRSGALSIKNWLLMAPDGTLVASFPEQYGNRSSRHYYLGPIEAAKRNLADRVHYSSVVRSVADGLHKLGISRVVRDEKGQVAGVLSAMVSTSSSDGTPGLVSEQRKTVLVSAGDPGVEGGDAARFLVVLHPGYHKDERATPIEHQALSVLLQDGDPPPGRDRDAAFYDPVSSSHAEYVGRWLAGFARVPETPYMVIFQTRDWVVNALVVGLLGLSPLLAFAGFRVIRDRSAKRA